MNEDLALECTRCEELTDFERESTEVVRCAECGKRHSTMSLDVEWGIKP